MKLSTLFSIFTLISLLFGLALLIFPGTMMSFYGASSLDALSTMQTRFIGGVAISLGIMSWLARYSESSKARDAIVLGYTIGNTVSALITIWSALSGMFNALIWIEAAIFIVFAAAFFFVGKASMSSN